MSKRLEEIFENPPGEYMPVPWWAWAGALEPDQMRRQLAMMHEQGIREFFIFPIYGLEVEYMSEEYLDRIGLTLEQCRKLGMRAWIYDEYNWPSGTAAGRVARYHPDAIAANLRLETYADATPEDVRRLQEDPAVLHVTSVQSDGNDIVVAYRRKRDETRNLTVKSAPWAKGDPGMLDMLSVSACRAFIEEAYEPIARRFPNELGKTIKGFFTDEPSIAPGTVPWTDALPERFERKYGYDLVPRLHDLSFPTDTHERTRRDYWSLVTEMHAEAFTGQIADWCEAHGLLLTGHFVHEENAYSVWYHGDTLTQLMRMHAPGCDLLGMRNSFDEPKGWYIFGKASLIKSAKHPASAARFAGRNRVMCEAWGVAPWSRTMADEKRMMDWLGALGVNLLNDNSLITDIRGSRKRAIAGKHFTQPWWQHAHLSYTYAGRVSAMLAETTLDTELLVLYPTTTWQAMAVREVEAPPELRQHEIAFDTTLDALVRKHWHFEFLPEQLLESSELGNGVLDTGHGTFKAIVLAGIARLRPETARKLAEFADAGGKVVLIGDEPTVMDAGGDKPLGIPYAATLEDCETPEFVGDLDATLKAHVARPWHTSGDGSTELISAARIGPDGRRMLFIANMLPGAKSLRIEWGGEQPVELWDSATGVRWLPEQKPGLLEFTLPEDESVWVCEGSKAGRCEGGPPAHFIAATGQSKEIGGPWVLKVEPANMFAPKLWLKPDADGVFVPGCAEMEFDHGWIELDEGDAGIPLGPEEMACYWLRAEIDLAAPVSNLQVVVDSEETEAAYLNGESLGESRPACVWDDANRAWDICERAWKGNNTLLLKVKTSPYYAQGMLEFARTVAEPVVLRGTFEMPGAEAHFAGTRVYEKSFDWTGPEGDTLIDVQAGRDVVEVLLDGVPLGVRTWGPRRFLARGLTRGDHTLQISITNTLGGILRRLYGGAVTPLPASGLGTVRITALE